MTEDTLARDVQGVAVIGMAGRFPGANTVDELWSVLCESRETISFFRTEELEPSDDLHSVENPNYIPARGVVAAQ